jgi:hypothetical protein
VIKTKDQHFGMNLKPHEFDFCESLHETLSVDRTETTSDDLMLELLRACYQSVELKTTLHPAEFYIQVFLFSHLLSFALIDID